MYVMRTTFGVFLLVGLGACELPTKLPTWDQNWVIPGDSTRFAVSEQRPALAPCCINEDELQRAVLAERVDRRQQHERLVERIRLDRVRGEIFPGGQVGAQFSRIPHHDKPEIGIRH